MSSDWTLTFNGLTCGPGTPYGVTSVDGWMDLQGVTTVDTPKPQADGTWTSPDFNPSRLVNVGLDAYAADPDTFAAVVAALEAATQTQADVSPVTLTIPGRDPETIYAKVRRRVIPTDFGFVNGLSSAQVQFFAPDPRRFGDTISDSTKLPTSTGGLTWPATWPLTWTGDKQQGDVSLFNPGNAAGPLVIRIDGPVTGPSVYLEDTGMSVAFSDALVMGAKDWLVIDMDARTALLRGTSSMAAFITARQWFGFQPGDNSIAFQSFTYDARALMTVTASPAWK
jgi:hypothetical protein